MRTIYRMRYATGKFVLCADAPEEIAGTVERLVFRSAVLEVRLKPEQLEELLVEAGVPAEDAQAVAASLRVMDDTYAVDERDF